MAANISKAGEDIESRSYKCEERIGNATVCKPPDWPIIKTVSIFFAGSIEMGKAIDWQSDLTMALSDLPITILNPRRDDWDSSWVQDIENAQFKEQVDWEMDHLIKADVIALFLQPETLSPISLLELGMHAGSGKMVVCCHQGFWRRGNVQIVCHRYGIPLVDTSKELAAKARAMLEKKIEERKNAT